MPGIAEAIMRLHHDVIPFPIQQGVVILGIAEIGFEEVENLLC
jgi:hypothetical protein